MLHVSLAVLSSEQSSLLWLRMLSVLYISVAGVVHVTYRIAGHPLAQNERCVHMFLLEPLINKDYVPGKVRMI